ncbi:MAG: hypothetical protein E2O37_06160 [Proteobacteria bacterium]|nr:MAG: hypothetical protein E2O37_06160 [Pseudomonadota bacterium]
MQSSPRDIVLSILCGDCKAVRILILGWDKHGYHPQHAVIRNGIWYAVHRDYAKQGIETPKKLRR